MYLDERVAKAKKCAKKAWDLAGAHPIEIKELADFDLKQLARAQPGIAEKLVAYQREFYLVIQARDLPDFTI